MSADIDHIDQPLTDDSENKEHYSNVQNDITTDKELADDVKISDDSDNVTMENIALSNEEEHEEGQSLSYVDVVLRNANNQQDQVIQKRLSR